MLKIFISQPMSGRPWHEVLKERDDLIYMANELFGDDAVVLDTIFDQDKPHPLIYLGMAIEKLAEADVIFAAPGWQKSRGCRIEIEAALAYGKTNIIEM